MIGLFDFVFPTYCCGIFVLASFVFYITGHFSWRSKLIQVLATEFSVALLFKHIFKLMFLRKTLGNQYCNGLKMPRVQAVYSSWLIFVF